MTESDSVTLSEYVSALKRGWIFLLLVLVISLACGVAVVASKPDVYAASARVYVQTVGEDGRSENSSTLDFTANRSASYAAVLGGNVAADQVATQLDGYGDETVTVTAPPGTVIIQISVTSSEAQRAAETANAYADIAPSVIEELDRDEAGRPRVQITTFDVAEVPTAPVPQARASVLLAFAIIGLGLGSSIVLVREVMRREKTGRSPDAEEPDAT